MFQLIKTTTEDKLVLHGLLSEGKKENPAVIHIHGFEGDFFTNEFIVKIAESLQKKNIAFLTAQTRGMGSEYLFKTADNKWKKYGGHFELLEDAYKDIDAWITALRNKGYSQIILQGHSLGTMKIVRYLFEGQHASKVKKPILLSVFDKTALLEKFTKTSVRDLLQKAQKKINEGREDEIVSKEFQVITVSYKTFVSWYTPSDFGRVFDFCSPEYNFPALQKVSVPVKIIVGEKDEYVHPNNPSHPQEAMEILKINIKNCETTVIPNATHGFFGYEDVLSKEVVEFI